MRYINPDRVREKISQEWHQKSAQALEKIKNLPPEERAEAINKLSHVWTELKDKLHDVSHGKCWYCETKDVRHDDEIDHWRPKNAVMECPEHPGYWWLAFDWQNFRYVCVFCNQKRKKDKSGRPDEGGKGTSFPLFNERQRISDVCHKIELRRERPVLLDPMVLFDTRLLKFDTEGECHPAKAAPSEGVAPSNEYTRAEKSIEVYHLNAHDLIEKRRTTICNRVQQLLDEGDGYYYCLEQLPDDLAASAGYENVINKLRYMLDEQHEYSEAARSVLRFYRKQYPWVNEVLDDALDYEEAS
ncbi:MAG TPA: hypothetical protein VFB60_26830 [Ktedonobacteraceae bacterium]|nr:hypothetical protein [Ktedonobacteraceae bacterium]